MAKNKIAMNEELRYLITKERELKEELKWCKVRIVYLKEELTKKDK